MATIKNSLPEDSRDYRVQSWTGENSGYMAVAVSSPQLEPEALYSMLESTLKPKLDKVEDADNVDLVPVRELISQVELQEDELLSQGLMLDEVLQAVRRGYQPEPVGSFSNSGDRYNVRLKKGIDSIFDIGNIRVARRGGRAIHLSDVSEVTVEYGLPNTIFRVDGIQSIMIFAVPKSG